MTVENSKVSDALGQIRAGQEQILEALEQIRLGEYFRLMPELEEIRDRQAEIMRELEAAAGNFNEGDDDDDDDDCPRTNPKTGSRSDRRR